MKKVFCRINNPEVYVNRPRPHQKVTLAPCLAVWPVPVSVPEVVVVLEVADDGLRLVRFEAGGAGLEPAPDAVGVKERAQPTRGLAREHDLRRAVKTGVLVEPVQGSVEVGHATEPQFLVGARHRPRLGAEACEGGAVQIQEVDGVAVPAR